MYAVIETGGKQYRVAPGESIEVETLTGDVGAEVEFDRVIRPQPRREDHRLQVQAQEAVQAHHRASSELHPGASERNSGIGIIHGT
jgi:ribosomal protein L21